MWFRVDSSNPLNFAHRFLMWERAHPCPPAERHRWPAFSHGGGQAPLRPEAVRAWHKEATTHVLGEQQAKLRTWHALRATLISALVAYRDKEGRPLDNVEGIGQMLVRWKSLESLRIYLKIRDSAYADYVDIATSTDGSNVAAEDLPPHGPEDAAQDIDRAIEALAAEAGGRPTKRKDAPPGEASTSAPAAAVQRTKAAAADGREAARAAAKAAAPQKGQRIEVDHGGEWWRGTAGTTKWSEADGAYITRVAYDAAGGWKATSQWHISEDFSWKQVA